MLMVLVVFFCFFFFKQKTAYEMRISDWSSDVCSSDLIKANHGSGSNIFVTEKDTPDWPAIEKEASSWLRQRYRPHLHERHYDKIDRQLLIEPYIGGGTLPSDRSEEHTSELQSLMRISYAVFCLKKKKTLLTGFSSLRNV